MSNSAAQYNPQEIVLGVSDFVALLNQTLEYAYPTVTITGELANFKVSKNRWVYFDLKDAGASVRFFGTVYQLPGPLEEGMLLAVRGQPRLHAQFGFSVNIQSMRPVGQGSIKKAAQLLQAKLAAEGLFDPARKRSLPYPPQHIGLITSAESAAYRDFVKVLGGRWGGVKISLIDVQVQGQSAVDQLVAAIDQANQLPHPPQVLVVTRGGGSADDLQAFSTEQVTRAVAASRIPTLIAIGHEVDESLAELAADVRASTPSNAAELLVPDRRAVALQLKTMATQLHHIASHRFAVERKALEAASRELETATIHTVQVAYRDIAAKRQLLQAFNPQLVLARGYSLVRKKLHTVTARQLQPGDAITVQFVDGSAGATVTDVTIDSND